MDYKAVNEWAAKECGVDAESFSYRFSILDGKYIQFYQYAWTIEDPRCREIVREMFKIVTDIQTTGGFYAHAHLETQRFKGKTIAEAECACIVAIWEASND